MIEQQEFRGVPVSHGIAFGSIYIYKPLQIHIDSSDISPRQIPAELSRLQVALNETIRGLQLTKDQALAVSGVSISQIFEAQIMLLEDESLLAPIRSLIKDHLKCAEAAVQQVMQQAIEVFSNHEDPISRDRIADISDVCRRFILVIQGKQKPTLKFNEPVILCARELTTSELMNLSLENLRGIVLEEGSETSHAAILARVFSIPTIVGIEHFLSTLKNDIPAIINGISGKIILHPNEAKQQKYQEKIACYQKFEIELDRMRSEKAETLDHFQVFLDANIELPIELDKVHSVNADGVGLFRTEYLYLSNTTLPDEETQFQAYFEVAKSLYPKPVIIRTFDLGGDKVICERYTKPESNPFMGFRAIRVSLRNPDLFRTQLRAILRASIVGNVQIMFPMINDLGEVRQIKNFLESVRRELISDSIPISPSIPIGIMVEIPSVAILIKEFLKEVDFASIGTNDLTQFTLAVDRNNRTISENFHTLHPAVLRLISMVIEEGKRQNKKISICGELAGSPMATMLLLALGADRLSMSPSLIPEIKLIIRSITQEECISLWKDIDSNEASSVIHEKINLKLRKRFSNVPIWFGR